MIINDGNVTLKKFNIEIINSRISESNNQIVVPINIKTDFNDVKKITILTNNKTFIIENEQIKKIEGGYQFNLVIDYSYKKPKLNIYISLFDNKNKQIFSDNKEIIFSKKLSMSSIVGITVTVVVGIALIGWTIFLVKKNKNEKTLKKYQNKLDKNA